MNKTIGVLDGEPSIEEYGLQYLAIGSGIRQILSKPIEGFSSKKSTALKMFNDLYGYFFVVKLVDFYEDFIISKLEVHNFLALTKTHKTIRHLMKENNDE